MQLLAYACMQSLIKLINFIFILSTTRQVDSLTHQNQEQLNSNLPIFPNLINQHIVQSTKNSKKLSISEKYRHKSELNSIENSDESVINPTNQLPSKFLINLETPRTNLVDILYTPVDTIFSSNIPKIPNTHNFLEPNVKITSPTSHFIQPDNENTVNTVNTKSISNSIDITNNNNKIKSNLKNSSTSPHQSKISILLLFKGAVTHINRRQFLREYYQNLNSLEFTQEYELQVKFIVGRENVADYLVWEEEGVGDPDFSHENVYSQTPPQKLGSLKRFFQK